MEPNMADGAVLELRIGHVMEGRRQRDAHAGSSRTCAVVAFKTKREDDRAFEQPRVGRPMRQVTRLAAFDAHGGVLESERAAQVPVTAEAGFFIHACLRYQAWPVTHLPGRCERPVRVMAVGAINQPLVDAMFERHGKLCAD